jgi:uncharacterized lipoprotein YehR (DUF1307 family)
MQFSDTMKPFIKIWLENEDNEKQIKTLLGGQEFVMFFQKGDSLYGGTEDTRLTFAKIKHPDEETSDEWVKDANFMAVNLTKSLKGTKVHNLFSKKDIKDIKIIDQDEAEKLLLKQAKNKKISADKIEPVKDDEDPTMNTIQLKDKK